LNLVLDQKIRFQAYKRLPGLREYLLLDNRRPQATLFQKGLDGVWRQLTFTEGALLPLDSIGLALPLAQLYEGITLDLDP
jgi:Uma2 family endonuclease